MLKILVINGPNIQLLGRRKPEIYGRETLADIESKLKIAGEKHGMSLLFFQSNCEGAIVDRIAKALDEGISGIIINPAAYTHTSIAIHDALEAVQIPAVEIHISNVFKREEFRHKSMTAPACIGTICGFGTYGYELALNAIVNYLKGKGRQK
ncbi:MAG: type II 3-dehydroquinate dehydratase [Candidatus Nanoarchaeia archaeon]